MLPEVRSFIIEKKRRYPDLSCRELAKQSSERFKLRISKSSINSVIKSENLSSAVGRKPRVKLNTDSAIDRGGALILRAIDWHLEITSIASKCLLEVMPSSARINKVDVENTIQCLILVKSLFDITIDLTGLYNNIEIWSLIGRRPSKKAFNLIITMLNESKLFYEKLVMEIKKNLRAVSGFQFLLSDTSSFFVDAQANSIWKKPKSNKYFLSTYCKTMSYINNICDKNEPIMIFCVLGSNVGASEVIDFIEGFNAEYATRKISTIEILDHENQIMERKFIYGPESHFFMIGFWPWQLETMYELERKPAKNRIEFRQIGLSYYYQIEDVIMTQPVNFNRVKVSAILIKDSPLGIVKIGILTNLPRETLDNYLKINKLHNWLLFNERNNLFTQFNNSSRDYESFFDWFSQYDFETAGDVSLEKMIAMLSQIIFQFFLRELLPEECKTWNQLKIKDVFLRQKAKIILGRDIIVHNLLLNNELYKKEHFDYLCLRINSLSIAYSGKLIFFQAK